MNEISVRNNLCTHHKSYNCKATEDLNEHQHIKQTSGHLHLAVRLVNLKPKCRSWILVFSRKERKDRKAYRDGGLLLDFQAHPLF